MSFSGHAVSLTLGDLRLGERLNRPDVHLLVGKLPSRGRCLDRPDRAVFHPGCEIVDLPVGQFYGRLSASSIRRYA